MTSAGAPTEPLAVQVMRAVLSSRLPAAPDQRQAIEDALAVHDSLCVRVAVGHSECEARCTRSAPVELWSVSVEEEREGGQEPPPLPALFLLNAVRSYVHFSQLSAWLRPASGGSPAPAAASYELLLTPAGAASALLAPPADATVVEHAFPLAADAAPSRRHARLLVRVAVRYVQRARPLSPTGLCLQLGRLPTDEWLLPSPLPSPTGTESLLGEACPSPALFESAALAATAEYLMARGAKHKASEPALYSPTGPALKQAHFGEQEEEDEGGELVIELARDECVLTRGDTLSRIHSLLEERRVEEEEEQQQQLRERESKEEEQRLARQKREEEEGRRVRRRAMMREKEKQPVVKKERRGGLRRMVGGWEECVLAGGMEERKMPQAGYTLTIVAASSSPVRLHLATASLADTVATCVARTTVAECERVREVVGQDRKMIRRRGLHVQPAGQLQMSLLNAEGTRIAALSIPYDVREMPEGAETMLRHRVRLEPKSTAAPTAKAPLRYLVQMSIARDRSGRCFVTGEITVVFTTDQSVDGANVEMDPMTGVARAVDRLELQAETITAPFSLKNALVVV